MILGYEQPVEIPVLSIYDKGLMLMYIQALLKNYYDVSDKLDKFIDKYGTFDSPISGASDAYYQAGVGGVMNKINKFEQSTGIDPMRSIAGRQQIEAAIRNADLKTMSTIKESAANKKIYDQAVAKAILNGTYDENFEKQRLKELGLDPDNWDHTKVWDRLAPETYQDPAKYWAEEFKNLPETDIMYDAAGKVTTDPSKAVTHALGVSQDRANNFVDANFDKYAQTSSYRYARDVLAESIKRNQAAVGNPITDETAKQMAEAQIKNQAKEMGAHTKMPKVDELYAFNKEMQYKNSRGGSRRGRGGSNSDYTIFEESAETDDPISFDPNNPIGYRINTLGASIKFHKETKETAPYYEMNTSDYEKYCHPAEDVINNTLGTKVVAADKRFKYRWFVPDGQLIYRRGRWFLLGHMTNEKGGNVNLSNRKNNAVAMEVKKRKTKK